MFLEIFDFYKTPQLDVLWASVKMDSPDTREFRWARGPSSEWRGQLTCRSKLPGLKAASSLQKFLFCWPFVLMLRPSWAELRFLQVEMARNGEKRNVGWFSSPFKISVSDWPCQTTAKSIWLTIPDRRNYCLGVCFQEGFCLNSLEADIPVDYEIPYRLSISWQLTGYARYLLGSSCLQQTPALWFIPRKSLAQNQEWVLP